MFPSATTSGRRPSPRRIGPHRLVVQAWTDRHATWAHKVLAKLDAGQPIDVEIAEGHELLLGAAEDPDVAAALRVLDDAGLGGPRPSRPDRGRRRRLVGPGAADVTDSAPQPLWVDRELALRRLV